MVKPVQFHPKVLEFIRNQSSELKRQVGEALRDIQKGMSVGMPLSKPMPSVAPGAHELRMKDNRTSIRVFYFVKLVDAVIVFHGFQKKTRRTPAHEIEVGRKRLREVVNGEI